MLGIATAHRVLPAVFDVLSHFPPGVVPDAIRRNLDATVTATVTRNLAVISQLRTAFAVLDAAGVRAAAAATPGVVSMSIGSRAYALRQANLLIAPGDAGRARDVLIASGCQPRTDHASDRTLLTGAGPGRAEIVLETSIADAGFGEAFPVASALGRAVDVRVSDRDIRMLAPVDRHVALCARGAAKGWARLDYIVAAAAIFHAPHDLAAIVALARTSGLRRAVETAAVLVRDVLEIDAPPGRQTGPRVLANYVARSAAASLFDPRPATAVRTALTQLASREGVVRQARYAAVAARRGVTAWARAGAVESRGAAFSNTKPSSPERPLIGPRPITGTPLKLILQNFQSPGDLVMLTAAVRDLHMLYPGHFVTDVRTPCPELWEHNPYVTQVDDGDPAAEVITCEYPLIHSSNQAPYHFIHGFIEFLNVHLGLQIRPTEFKGDIHLSDAERERPSPVRELTGIDAPYWIVAAGGKYDYTTKWWSHARHQAVVDHFRDRVLFVQIGERGHHHPMLRGVVDLRGRTSLRDLIRLVHHADGVITPVSLLMHLAAAVETVPGRPALRPCVVIAGGREPVHWEAYPGHQFLHTIGALACCETGGCWRSRVLPIEDGDSKDDPDQLCLDVVDGLPRCMDLITPDDVIRRMELHLSGPGGRVPTPGWREPISQPTSAATEPPAPHSLPIWCEPCPLADVSSASETSTYLIAEGSDLDGIRDRLDALQVLEPGRAPRVVVGANAVTRDVREYLFSKRLAGTIHRLHESPVRVSEAEIMFRMGASVAQTVHADRIISSPTPAVGLVIGTFAAVPYVHLALESRRRHYPDVPLLVHDDASPEQDRLRSLCREYGAEFVSTGVRGAHARGDLSTYVRGMGWAEETGLELLVKMSRRFIAMHDWVPGLQRLAYDTQYATYSNQCLHYHYGFRTECVAFHAASWRRAGAIDEMKDAMTRGPAVFVEGLVHELARLVHQWNCGANRDYEARHPRPSQADAYGPWPIMAERRIARKPNVLWHDADEPADYCRQARLYGLPYRPRRLRRSQPRAWIRRRLRRVRVSRGTPAACAPMAARSASPSLSSPLPRPHGWDIWCGCPRTNWCPTRHSTWDWSRRLAASYNDANGPGVVWLIAASTRALGVSEWSVRLPATIAMAIAATAGTRLAVESLPEAGRRTAVGVTAALLFLGAPALQGYALFMTPDAPAIACWTIGAYAAWRVFQGLEAGTTRLPDWLCLGAAVGLGLLFELHDRAPDSRAAVVRLDVPRHAPLAPHRRLAPSGCRGARGVVPAPHRRLERAS